MEAVTVIVEVDVSYGLPVFTMVGLPDASVRESRDRVRTAIRNSGFEFPGHRITVNLAPADIRKAGASYDLPIALGVLAANGVVEPRLLRSVVLLGELSLDGSIQAIRGVLPVAIAARRSGTEALLLPRANAAEAGVVEGLRVLPVESLAEAVGALNNGLETCARAPAPATALATVSSLPPDLSDVRGQTLAKRALEIAAAGAHNLLFIGSPGGGKTMMARRLPGLLPPLDFDEALDCTSIHSVAGTLPPGTALMQQRPFRAPHHTISEAAMVGGGAIPRPGEISLAHNGVLFLDELPEFDRRTLEALRQPLEEGRVTITRAARTASFPARFMLLAAMNPCPCGFRGDPRRMCRCSDAQVQRYAGRISGPLRDRIDLVVEVAAGATGARERPGCSDERSAVIQQRVVTARARQHARFADASMLNRQLEGKMLGEHCRLDRTSAALLDDAVRKFCLSARGYDRVLRVSRTLADLAGADRITSEHVGEALQYRFAEPD